MSYWGEYETGNHNYQEDWSLSFSDLEELLFPHPPSPVLPPSVYQPSQEETASFQILPPEMCRSDPTVLQTIKLLNHQRQLIQLHTRAQTYGLDISAAPPPFPEDLPVERKAAKHHYLNFLPPSETPFTVGLRKAQKFEIESSTARLILRKAVATVCAHTGYTDTTESVLKVLTDVTHDFLTKFTSTLRTHMDNMLLTGNCPFHDVVEQTLHTMRMGGMAELHKMYKDRVLSYYSRVRQRTLQLHHQYQSLLLLHANAASSNQALRKDGNLEAAEVSHSSNVTPYRSVSISGMEASSSMTRSASNVVEAEVTTQLFSSHN